MASKTALITGVTGQDGSYLAELLLSKGYRVYGLVRRLSSPNLSNLAAVREQIEILDGDLTDQTSLNQAVKTAAPDEIYNLAAQSFVHTSFTQPVLTGEITGLGAIRLLEAARSYAPHARFYQASSSEMFGHVESEPQDESTAFHPRSPYGVAKVYAYWACVNYREAYEMFVSNGILFNHECTTSDTPLIVRSRSGMMDCLPISDLLPDPNRMRQAPLDFDVWDQGSFTRATLGTASFNGPKSDRGIQRVIARCGEIRATANHQLIREDGTSVPTRETPVGTHLMRTELPDPPGTTVVPGPFAQFLGLMAAEGSVYSGQSGGSKACFRNNDRELIDRMQRLWEHLTGGSAEDDPGISGFTGRPTLGLRLNGSPGFNRYLREILYSRDSWKRVPRIVLNSTRDAWIEFLRGYNWGDGLRAGHGTREFKNFKTASPALAAGLWWMASRVLDQKPTFNVDFVRRGEFQEQLSAYYSLDLGSVGGPSKGRHLLKPAAEVKHVNPEPYVGWVYDVATASGTFHAGIGDLVVHNSPRRGLEFVTRKVTDGMARIALGKAKTLTLGNLEAKRDWGYAPEYVELMWRTLQNAKPGDYVGATGESHTVRELVEAAAKAAGVEHWEKHVETHEKFDRPAEVHNLRGNPTRAKRDLGWEPHVRFPELVRIMVEADLARHRDGRHGPTSST
jgi:GDPmannose 4,6-dehydratase